MLIQVIIKKFIFQKNEFEILFSKVEIKSDEK